MIYLWTYRESRRNFPGYHLSTDANGCATLGSVFTALSAATTRQTEKVVLMSVSSEALSVPNNSGGNASVLSFTEWVVETAPGLDDGHQRFEESNSICRLRVSPQRAAQITSGVKDILAGKGDYCIGVGDDALWFWWQPTPNPALQRTLQKRRR